MGYDLFFHILLLLGLLCHGLLLYWAWRWGRPTLAQMPPTPPPPVKTRSTDPKPFPGLIHQPLCDACVHDASRPQAPSAPVWLNNSAESRHIAIVIPQEPSQAFATLDLTGLAPKVWLRGNELVGEALMVALGMIVGQILVDHIRQCWFAQYHHVTQGFLFDRADEPFAVRIQIWALRW